MNSFYDILTVLKKPKLVSHVILLQKTTLKLCVVCLFEVKYITTLRYSETLPFLRYALL